MRMNDVALNIVCSNLNKKRNERMILEIQFHLVAKSLPSCGREEVWSKDFRGDIKRSHDCIFFVHLDAIEKKKRF